MTRAQSHQLEERRSRALTDQDVKALADELERRFTHRFYDNLGRGLWGFAWKGVVAAVMIVAAYGAAKGIKP